MSRRAAPDDVMDIFESSVPSAPVPAAPVLVRTRERQARKRTPEPMVALVVDRMWAERIDAMSQADCARIHRKPDLNDSMIRAIYSRPGGVGTSIGKYFMIHFRNQGGFTLAISKQIGWD